MFSTVQLHMKIWYEILVKLIIILKLPYKSFFFFFFLNEVSKKRYSPSILPGSNKLIKYMHVVLRSNILPQPKSSASLLYDQSGQTIPKENQTRIIK